MFIMWILNLLCYSFMIISGILVAYTGIFQGLYLVIIFFLLARLFHLIDIYHTYRDEKEELHGRRIPIVTMDFNEFKSYYNLFKDSFFYGTFDNSFHWYDSPNMDKMFYKNELSHEVNRIAFPSFSEWVKFYFWNKHRLYVKKQFDKFEEKEAYKEEYKRITKRNNEDDRRATELVYQDLLNKVEKEVKLANQEIKQGLDGMKQVVGGI